MLITSATTTHYYYSCPLFAVTFSHVVQFSLLIKSFPQSVSSFATNLTLHIVIITQAEHPPTKLWKVFILCVCVCFLLGLVLGVYSLVGKLQMCVKLYTFLVYCYPCPISCPLANPSLLCIPLPKTHTISPTPMPAFPTPPSSPLAVTVLTEAKWREQVPLPHYSPSQ